MEHSKETAWGEMQKAGYIAEDAIPRNGGQWPEYAHAGCPGLGGRQKRDDLPK